MFAAAREIEWERNRETAYRQYAHKQPLKCNSLMCVWCSVISVSFFFYHFHFINGDFNWLDMRGSSFCCYFWFCLCKTCNYRTFIFRWSKHYFFPSKYSLNCFVFHCLSICSEPVWKVKFKVCPTFEMIHFLFRIPWILISLLRSWSILAHQIAWSGCLGLFGHSNR